MKTLLIPIYIDAMRLEEPLSVRNPSADYSRIPFNDGKKDINSDTPPISESILSDPFETSNFTLPKGIHLHWALPDGLTKGVHSENGTYFKTVPNRWLITRLDKNNAISKQWVVESDFIYPDGYESSAVTLPLSLPKSNYPYRHIGRQLPLEIWKQLEDKDKKDKNRYRLTAVGLEPNVDIEKLPSFNLGWQESEYGTIYREPLFASYYPNCYSIFGAYDNLIDFEGSIKDCTYEVFGWYSDKEDNPLDEIEKLNFEDKIERVKKKFGWSIFKEVESSFKEIEENDEFPSQIVCFGQITFTTNDNLEHPDKLNEEFKISIADSSIEALSSHLANTLTKDSKNKEQLEEQFEVLNLQDNLNKKVLDLTPRIREARHNERFDSVYSGSNWEVKLISKKSSLVNSLNNSEIANINISKEIYQELEKLNKLQEEYDTLIRTIKSFQERTFADWYKYLLSSYPPMESIFELPDSDIIRYFIENRDLAPLENLQERYSELTSMKFKQEESLKDEIAKFNKKDNVKKSAMECQLYKLAKPRYWTPKEPVIMIESNSCISTNRHGKDKSFSKSGLLESVILNIEDRVENILKLNPTSLRVKLDELVKNLTLSSNDFMLRKYEYKPWNPLLLDWNVRVYPLLNYTNSRPEEREFNNNLMQKIYQLNLENSDFSIKDSGESLETLALNASIYSGTSILTPTTADYFEKNAREYLSKHFPNVKFEEYKNCEDLKTKNKDEKLIEILKKCCQNEFTQEMFNDPICTTLYAYMEVKKGRFLSQVLSGFNNALLMQKQTMQVPICDPLEFSENTNFYKRIEKALGVENFNAPQPLNDFLPLRTGGMKLLKLRLVDTFGRVKDIEVGNIATPERMRNENNPNLVIFPPRFMQPLKLNFRWLWASSKEEESIPYREKTPICGWLLINHFGSRLMVYDAHGYALGSLIVKNQKVKWDYAPGIAKIDINSIENFHLRKIVKLIAGVDEETFNKYLSVIEYSLESIEPNKIETPDSMALLIGRPLAIVRAKVDLEIAGLPVNHLGWDALKNDINTQSRTTNGFTEVKFPIRIGEYQQLDDGLAGYFIESNDEFIDNTFYSLQKESRDYFKSENLKIKTLKNNNLNIYTSISSKPIFLTMLLDPRGSVHASAGVVPTKEITIPESIYVEALENFYVTFLVSPILSDINKLSIPLPETPDFTWSWIEKSKSGKWLEIPTIQLIEKKKFIDEIVNEVIKKEEITHIKSEAEKLWNELNSEKLNWLSPMKEISIDDAWSSIVPNDERKKPFHGSIAEGKELLIQKVLDLHYVGLKKEDGKASFTKQKILREGWLKLSPANSKNKIQEKEVK